MTCEDGQAHSELNIYYRLHVKNENCNGGEEQTHPVT